MLSVLLPWSLALLLLLNAPPARGAEKQGGATRLYDIKDLKWSKLPEELTGKVTLLSDVKMKVAKTAQGSEYLQVAPFKKSPVRLRIKDSESGGSYRVESKEAFYWPELHLLSLSNDVIISASNCSLEGKTFDILLSHDTSRLLEPKVITLPNGLTPIESNSLRISGLGKPTPPTLKWDAPPESKNPPLKLDSSPAQQSGKQVAIHIQSGKKILYQDEPVEMDALQNKLRSLAASAPDSTFVIMQSPSANAKVVKKIHDMLEESGFDKIETFMDQPTVSAKSLAPDDPDPVHVEVDSKIPTGPGGRLLWCYSPGKYFLNGKPFDEASLRHSLRALAKESPEVPLVVGGPKDAPANVIRDLATEIKGYGFRDIQVAFPR